MKKIYENEEETEILSPEDEGLDIHYKINIFGDLYLIAPGNVKIHPGNNKVAYLNVYLLLNKRFLLKSAYMKNLLTMIQIQVIYQIRTLIENMELLLFQKFYLKGIVFSH